MPQIGSVCSGGRYDELASLYTTRKLPGVGAAIGLDRLLAALESLGISKRRPGYTDILVLNIEDDLGLQYHALASDFRKRGYVCEVFAERKKLAQQFAYAEKKAIPFAIVLDRENAEKGIFAIRDLQKRENIPIASVENAVDWIKERLSR